MKKIFLSLVIVATSITSLAEENKINFPAKPDSLKSCYQSGQDWINRQKWIVLASDKKQPDLSYDFNKALSDCLWLTPEATNFKWPKAHEPNPALQGIKLIAKNSAGDLFVANIRYEDTLANYLKISAKDGSVQTFTGPALRNAYFYGFDFAAYDFGQNERAVGIQTVYLSKESAMNSLSLVGGAAVLDDKPYSRTYLQSFKEIISKDQKTNNWVTKKYLFSIEPDAVNFYPKIIEKIRAKEAADLASLQADKTTKPLPESSKTYRWNGNQFDDGDVSEWLTKFHQKKPVEPKMVKTKTEGKMYSKGDLQFKDVTELERPTGKVGGSSTVQWSEITKGLNDSVRTKINSEIKTLVIASSAGMMGPNDNPEDPTTFLYGESSSTSKIYNVYKNVLTVLFYSSSQAPSSRSYDEGTYLSFNLATGEKINWDKSFKSFREQKLFYFTVISQLKATLDYTFSAQVSSKKETYPVLSFAVIPHPDQIEIICEGNEGGHFFEEDCGKIGYVSIAKHWVLPKSEIADLPGVTGEVKAKTPEKQILSPQVICKTETEEGPLKTICDLKLSKSYDELLMAWQYQLEQKTNQADFDKVSADYAEFTTSLETCNANSDCIKNKIAKKLAVLQVK